MQIRDDYDNFGEINGDKREHDKLATRIFFNVANLAGYK